MSEEFVRCSECGNLNIQGSTRCVFCDNPIIKEEAEALKEELPVIPSAPTVEGIPAPGDSQEESIEKASPKIPDIEIAKVEPKKKGVVIKDDTIKEHSFTRKFFMISLYTILISAVHYLLNLLVSVISVRIDNNNVNAYPLSSDLNQYIGISVVSIVLGIPFAIAIGYILGKVIRKFTTKKSSLIKWFSYAVFLDLIINTVIALGLILAFNALAEKDILFLKLAGSAFIFVTVSIITLFIPMISGSFLFFSKVDKIFFPKKYAEL